MPFTKDGTFYIDKGQGNPLLLVHGWCMSSTVWQQQIDFLSNDYRIIAPDLTGHGKSRTSRTITNGFASLAADIVNLIEQLQLENITIVGWSMGAQVMLKAYEQLKARVTAQVFVGATPCFISNRGFPFALEMNEARGMAAKLKRNQDKTLTDFQQSLFAEREFDCPLHREQTIELLATIRQPSTETALAGINALMTENLLNEAAAINCPALVVHGSKDRICLPEAGKWLADQIKGSCFLLYKNCGHAPFLSHPARFNNDLLNFLGKVYASN